METKKHRNNFTTGLGLVLIVMIGIIALPFVIPLMTALMSIGIAIISFFAVVFFIILCITAIGGTVNAGKDGKIKEFTNSRITDGKSLWNKLKTWLSSFKQCKPKQEAAPDLKEPLNNNKADKEDVIYSEYEEHY